MLLLLLMMMMMMMVSTYSQMSLNWTYLQNGLHERDIISNSGLSAEADAVSFSVLLTSVNVMPLTPNPDCA